VSYHDPSFTYELIWVSYDYPSSTYVYITKIPESCLRVTKIPVTFMRSHNPITFVAVTRVVFTRITDITILVMMS